LIRDKLVPITRNINTPGSKGVLKRRLRTGSSENSVARLIVAKSVSRGMPRGTLDAKALLDMGSAKVDRANTINGALVWKGEVKPAMYVPAAKRARLFRQFELTTPLRGTLSVTLPLSRLDRPTKDLVAKAKERVSLLKFSSLIGKALISRGRCPAKRPGLAANPRYSPLFPDYKSTGLERQSLTPLLNASMAANDGPLG
jgi:hypothetical protein